MNQPKSQMKVSKWLWITLLVVVVASGLYYYFAIYKTSQPLGITVDKSTSTSNSSPSINPTLNQRLTPTGPTSTSQPSTPNNQTPTPNPNLTTFNYNPVDSLWPNAITVGFNALGNSFDKQNLVLGTVYNQQVQFGTDYSYYPSTDAIATARADAQGNAKNGMLDHFTYEEPTALTVSGLSAGKYKWSSDSKGAGISVIVLVYPGVGQKALKITGFLNNISERDFNNLIESILITK